MMEQPIVNTKDERVLHGNLNSDQIREMRSHNLYTKEKPEQEGWTFRGVGKTDTYAIPWNFQLDGYPYNFIALQHKNIYGTDQIVIFMCDTKFNFNLNVMAEIKTYIGGVDLKSAINQFVYDFPSIIEN